MATVSRAAWACQLCEECAVGEECILEPPPERGCVRRTSRSKCGCPKVAELSQIARPRRVAAAGAPHAAAVRFRELLVVVLDAPVGESAIGISACLAALWFGLL
jgi:hypothetical protein